MIIFFRVLPLTLVCSLLLSKKEWAQAACLDDPVPPELRKNVTVGGLSVPLGLWPLNWASGIIPMQMMRIIAEDRLGYNVEVGAGGSSSHTAVYAVGGCDEGTVDCLDELVAGTREVGTRWHLSFDMWHWGSRSLTRWQEKLPAHAPVTKDLELGYPSIDGHYVFPEIVSTALEAEGLTIGWYQGYNSSWHDPAKYFTSMDNISKRTILPCSAGSVPNAVLGDYNRFFPDDTWVYEEDGAFKLKCLNDTWWLSAACREEPSKCVPYLDYAGWASSQILQMATHYNMPIAYANVESWGEVNRLARETQALTYWYEPDITYVNDNIQMIGFPPFNKAEHDNGWKVTNMQGIPTNKVLRPDLQETDLRHVVQRFTLTMAQQRAMMSDVDTGATEYHAACSWMRQHMSVWEDWLPDKTSCVEGQGLVDVAGVFVDAPESGVNCQWCDPGSSSQVFGDTTKRVCSECSAGTFQKLYGQFQCEQCPAGRFTSQEGTTVCVDCPIATFADGPGNTDCSPCTQAHETTVFRAAQSKWECVCAEGYYRAHGHSEAGDQHTVCAPCPGGMHCAAGGETPVLLPGYWADESDADDKDFSVFRCRTVNECPGGAVGSCAEGREGIGCASCKPNHHIGDKGKCKQCEGVSPLRLILACVAAVVGVIGITRYASRDIAKGTPQNTIAMGICLGQAVFFVQSLQVLSVLKVDWSEPFKTILHIVSVLSFDLDKLHIACFLTDSNAVSKYAITLLMFPGGVLLLILLMNLRGVLTKDAITSDQMVNACGLLMLVFFLILNLQGIVPFHCVSSPNGSSSLSSNPAVTCYEGSEWPLLAVFGATALLVYGVVFFSWVTWITYRYPSMVVASQSAAVTIRYTFLFQRFSIECYYFAPFYLLRSLTISILPVIFADYGHRQVISLSVAIVMFGSLMAWLKPLRGTLPNALDVIVNAGLVMSLLCGGLLTEVDKDLVNTDSQILLTMVVTVVFGTILSFIGWLAWHTFKPAIMYVAFLCHHKVGCGVGARLMKLDLEQQLKGPVFLDSDNLGDLEELLDIVRCSVKNFIILLTSETLSRPWCAGEVVTALTNKLRIIPVAFDGYGGVPEDQLTVESIKERWRAEEFAICQRSGVTLELVREAYIYVQHLPKVVCDRVASCLKGDLKLSERANKQVAALCRGETLEQSPDMHVYSDGSIPMGPQSPMSSMKVSAVVHEFDAAIVANRADPEAISSSAVLSRLLRQQTQWQVVEILDPCEVKRCIDANTRPKSMLVLLSEGALFSEEFVKLLLTAVDTWHAHMKCLPVVLERFAYPSNKVLEGTIAPKVSSALGRAPQEIAGVLEQIFTLIAARFSGTASAASLHADVTSMITRLNGRCKISSHSSEGSPPVSPKLSSHRASSSSDESQPAGEPNGGADVVLYN